MAKLSKAEAKAHEQACSLLEEPTLTFDERWFVYENWQESANHVNSIAGAFFTPIGLARDFSIEVSGDRIIDLCAGIGVLSFAASLHIRREQLPEIVCVEKNPAYVAVGRKLLPEATWIEADVFDLPDLGHFDTAISNPPFGATPRRGGAGKNYTGPAFEYHVLDVASTIADYGVFILPQASAPFSFSGGNGFRKTPSESYERFGRQTGIVLDPSCGIDTAFYRRDWRGVSPATEIVTANFEEARERLASAQADMFQEAAQ